MLSRYCLVAVEGLAKHYRGRTAVSGISVALPPGTVHGFLGANGAGKTTTLRMLAGILPPDKGQGHVLGFDIGTCYREIRKHVGYAAQRLSLYADLSVLDNLLFRARLHDLVTPLAAVETMIHNFGLEAHVGQRAGTLSGGWARRLQIAAALVHRPRLILLDEPTAGLDALASQDLWRRIKLFTTAGCAVIVNTHDLSEAARCDTISLFHEGGIAVRGRPAEVARRAPAEAYLVYGPDAPLLEGLLDSLAGVIDTRPELDRLRVVIDRNALSSLRALVAMYDAELVSTEMRLTDAALVYQRRPVAGE